MNFHGPSDSGLSQIGILVRFLRGAIAAERIRVESVPSSMPRRSLNRADSALFHPRHDGCPRSIVEHMAW